MDVVTSAADMHHLTVPPKPCRLLGSFGCDNCTRLGIGCNEQDGTLDACDDLAPSNVINCCKCRLQDIDIQLGFGVSPGDNLLFGPGRIQSEPPGDPLFA